MLQEPPASAHTWKPCLVCEHQDARADRHGNEMGQTIMNCPHPSAPPGCAVMKLYTAHWLEDRRRASELGFNQFSDKHGLDSFPPLTMLWFLHPSPSSWQPREPQPCSCSPGMELPSCCRVRILGCAGGHHGQESSTCVQLDWGTSAPSRAEGSQPWLAVQVAAAGFI